jgi:hypothetical protein
VLGVSGVEEHVHVLVLGHCALGGLCLLPVYFEDASFVDGLFLHGFFLLIDDVTDACLHVLAELFLAVVDHIQEILLQMGYFGDGLFLYLSLEGSHLFHLLVQAFSFLLDAFLFSRVFIFEFHEETAHVGHGEGSLYAEHVDLEDAHVDACLDLADQAELFGHGGVFFLSKFNLNIGLFATEGIGEGGDALLVPGQLHIHVYLAQSALVDSILGV